MDSTTEGRGGHQYEVIVVGAGFAGIGMAICLRRAGIEDFLVFEKADRVGGTWRDNTYPGAACDVPSRLYSFSFHQRQWPRRYSAQPDILEYLEEVVEAFGIRPWIRLGSEVEAIEFDEQEAVWSVTPANGGTVQARAVVSAVGQLNRPAYADVPGVHGFAGAQWHSARWNHEVDLSGRRVAVIGTGASAIQFVPRIAEKVASLHVFQRSAPYVVPKSDRPYADEDLISSPISLRDRAERLGIFLGGEAFTTAVASSSRLRSVIERGWRGYLRRQIADPELRAKCTPDYVMGCKRILIANDWYPTLARPNVELVTDPIAEVTSHAVRTIDGAEREVDCLIHATGFQSTGFLQPMRVVGRDGRDIHGRWAGGAEAFRGITLQGFPNLFMLYGPNTNLGSNSIIVMLEAQMRYVVQAVEALRSQRLAWVDVRRDVEREFNEWVDERSKRTAWETGCHSWYTTASGKNTNNWPSYVSHYRALVRHFDLLHYEVRPLEPNASEGAAGEGAAA